jgi:hypothetical protein
LEKLIMTYTKLIAHTLLAGFALLNLTTALKASATPITVTRGPNGAAVIIDSENIPVDAKASPTSPNRSFPELMTRGSHGASFVTAASQMKSEKQAISVPNLVTRGSHGAAVIANE